MSDNTANTYTLLHLRFRLQVPPAAFLAHSQEAAARIAHVKGLLWKVWIYREDDSEIGGMYLFADVQSAKDYLNHPIVLAVCSHPAVVSTASELWQVEPSLSAITRGPLPASDSFNAAPTALVAGGL